MTPMQRRLAKLEQAQPMTNTGTWGIAYMMEDEDRDEVIKRTFANEPIPDNLILVIGVEPKHNYA